MVGQCEIPGKIGMSVRMWEFSRNLAKMGHNVKVIASRRRSAVPKYENIEDVEIFRVPEIRKPSLFLSASVVPFGFLKGIGLKKDIVHTHVYFGQMVGLGLKCFDKFKLFYDYHGFVPEEYLVSGFIRKGLQFDMCKRLDLFLKRRADHIVTISEEMTQYISNKEGIDAARMFDVANGANRDFFNEKIDGSDIKNEINPNGKIVIHVGLMEKWANLGAVVDSFKYVVRKDPSVKFLIVGGGAELENMKSIIREHNLEDNTVFTGFVPYTEVAKYINASDVGLLTFPDNPLSHCGIPIKIFEYLSCGIPVVSTYGDSVKSFCKNHDCGYVVDSCDPRVFGKKIVDMLSDETSCKRMGVNGMRIVKEKYTWDALTKRLNKFYQRS